MYDYQTLTLTNIDGSISPFANGASGLILLGTGTSTPPSWGTLANVNTGLSNGVARIQDNYLVSGAIALGSTDTAGILPVTKGGTGIGTQGIEGILVGNGTSNFSAVSTSGVSNGDVLAKTANGYAFITLGSATVPPITDLQSGATSANIGQFLKVNNDLEPEWADIGTIVGDYLPLAGGRMDGLDMSGKYASVLSTWIGETSGWYTGLTHGFWDGTHRNASATSNVFRVTTKIGTQNVEFGDYIIRIHGYNTDDSSETIDYYVYLSNTIITTNNNEEVRAKGRYLQRVRGFRNKGSIVPLTFVAYGHDSSTDCLSLQFTLTEQKNLVLAVDFISHDLARGNIIDRNSYDYQALSGWNLHDDEASSGSGSPLNILEEIITDGAITDIPSGSGSATSKVLIGGNSETATPTWSAVGDINTGLSNGIVRVNSGNFTVTGSAVTVAEGGTGKGSLTPYALLAGGTTNTGSIQQLGTATTDYVLVGNGASALPTWQEKAPKATLADSATTATTAGSANTLTTPRTLTIGNTGKSFDGSANVSWSQNEIGFASGQTKSFSLNGASWHRIASSSSRTSFGHFLFYSNNRNTSVSFYVSFSGSTPQIKQDIYTYTNTSNVQKVRIVYESINSEYYLEIYIGGGSNYTINLNVELTNNVNWTFLNTPIIGEIPTEYHYLQYNFNENAFGTNGQFLKTVSNVPSTGNLEVAKEWATLPTIPSAPSSLPLVDNETGALGTAGTYANADHQHPLPYAVQAAYKFFYPRKIGIGGAITAEAQEYDGTSDLILQVTEIDPAAIINTVPIEKGGTGASTASQALTNLGAAASNHNHDSTYLKLSGGNMTGTINTPANVTPLYWAGKSGVATFVSGDLTAQDNVNSYVTGRRQNINLYDSDVSADSASPTTINHTAKNDTTVNIVCGINEVRRYTRYINLPTPTADMLGDTITVYFTNQKPSVIAELFATCSTNYRIKSYDYSNFGNTAGVDANCKWSSGNVVQFTCINLENNGTTYYWRAVKLVEQSW